MDKTIVTELPSSTEIGKLNVMHLKRYWSKSILKRSGKLKSDDFNEEWKTDTTLLTTIGLGLEQTIRYVFVNAPSFDEFEDWVLETTGQPDAEKIGMFNRLFADDAADTTAPQPGEAVLTKEDFEFWDENGYLIIRNAVNKGDCDDVIQVLCDHLGIERYDPTTWYHRHQDKQGIMVQLFQHPALEKNRRSPKIRAAYEQLWQRKDIWVSTDRVSFNPPETRSYPFQGPRLHWDVSLHLPIPFGLQGLLYLSDTAENQGAFTLIPGFQNRIDKWINSLPEGANPRTENLYALGPKPIAANAGDFILWHQALPHGSSPNTANVPRFVQYINYAPVDEKESDVWI